MVKKNGPRLRALKNWLFAARPEVLAACPILIIDDEADQATVNTAKPDRQPSRINGLIRRHRQQGAEIRLRWLHRNALLRERSHRPRRLPGSLPAGLHRRPPAPAAIHRSGSHLWPRAPDFDATDVGDDGHDFVRSVGVDELDDLKPKGAAKRHEFDPRVTDSLDEALRYFLMSTAARRFRGKGNPHATALVHTSQHIDVHERTADAIRDHLELLNRRLQRGDEALLETLRVQWETECDRVPATDFNLDNVN